MSDFEATRPERPTANLNWLVVFLLLLVGVLVWRTLNPGLTALFNPQAAPRPIAARGDLAEDEKSTIAIFKQASPSVVHITSLRKVIYQLQPLDIPEGTGTGFVWSEDGYIVTNYHVVFSSEKTTGATVALADGKRLPARLVGAAPEYDLAVLKIDAPAGSLRPILIGESGNLQVGQKVFAIGNPFGLDQTLTTGVIGGLNREIKSRLQGRIIKGVIQTDAAINPGNSGGPLLDSAGRLIGINTMIVSPSGVNVGIGYAVPVDIVNRVVPQIIQTGKPARVGMGIEVASDLVVAMMIKQNRLPREGVLIANVPEGSAAAQAGLVPCSRSPDGEIVLGDLIVGIDGENITKSPDLIWALQKHKPGDHVKLKVLRESKEIETELTLQALE
ncbi:MAG: trypsin-like peptidase domain-containing protein [Planctomycetales bacterium]